MERTRGFEDLEKTVSSFEIASKEPKIVNISKNGRSQRIKLVVESKLCIWLATRLNALNKEIKKKKS